MPCVTSCKVTAENKGSYETEQLGMCPSPNPSRRGYCTGANRHKVSEQYPTSNQRRASKDMDEEKDRSGCRRLEDIEDRNFHHILAQHVEHSTEYDPKRYEHIV